MAQVSFFSGKQIPLEMHKVRIVQKLNLLPVEQRLQAMADAGNNTFLLQNKDVFMDMLTDSGATVVGPAGGVKEALGVIDSEEIDGALLDVNLGGEQSFEVGDRKSEVERAHRACPVDQVAAAPRAAPARSASARSRSLVTKGFCSVGASG